MRAREMLVYRILKKVFIYEVDKNTFNEITWDLLNIIEFRVI